MKADDLLRVGRLFDRKEWPRADENGQFPFLFERFATMCARLSADELVTVLAVAEHYEWVTPDQYWPVFSAVWRRLISTLNQSTKSVVLAPMIESTSKRPKSADHLLKLVEGYRSNLVANCPGRRFTLLDSTKDFGKRFGGVASAALVLVDDYVGTGDTAVKALNEFWTNCPAARGRTVFIIALAAQQTAIARLRSLGVRVEAGFMLARGISDNLAGFGATAHLAVMSSLEERMEVSPDYRLGYGRSEAAVTLLRTPNNTLPVFWTNKKVGSSRWIPPFER